MVGFPAAPQPLPPTDTSSTNHSLTRKTNQSPCSETTLAHTEETSTEGSESQRHSKYGWISTTSRNGRKKKNKTHTAVAKNKTKQKKQQKKDIYFALSLTHTHRWAWTIIGTSVVVPAIISAKEDERKSYSWNIKAGIFFCFQEIPSLEMLHFW